MNGELGWQAFWVVSGVGFLSGLLSLWAFRRWTNTIRLCTAINQILAHLLEFRLFADEPALVMRAQRDLLVANARFLREVSGPSLLLAFPLTLLFFGMNGLFGRTPLRLESPAVVTVQFHPTKAVLPLVQLTAPEGIEVETPPVRLAASSQVCWRIRPHQVVHGWLMIHRDNRDFTKSVSSGSRLQWLSPVRAGSVTRFLLSPLEWPLPHSEIESVTLSYPPALILGFSWIVWFSLALLAGSLAYILMPPHLLAILN